MKNINIANDIAPLGVFKTRISRSIRQSKRTGRPIIITLNGKPAAVVITPADFDQLQEIRQFTESVSRGLSDAEEGSVLTTRALIKELKKRRLNGFTK